jgi:hypothetical protein
MIDTILRTAAIAAIVTATAGTLPAQAGNANRTCASVSTGALRAWWGKEMVPSKFPGIVDCQWVPADGSSGSLTVQVVPARYYEEARLGADFKRLQQIGDRAFIVRDMGGWNAGALKGAKAIVIHADGGKTTRATAIEILKTLIPTV